MDNIDVKVGEFILFIVALIFSGSVHEAPHAWTSSYFGDDLARSQGRVSLNPVVHVDPFGTLLFPAISFFTGATMLGWARATPTNPLRWRNKKVANFWVSIAGILGNLGLAIIAGVALRVMFETGYLSFADLRGQGDMSFGVMRLVEIFFILNVSLAVFNLLPIPPLDGSKVLYSVLPASAHGALDALEQYSYLILIAILYFGVVGRIIAPIRNFVIYLLYL